MLADHDPTLQSGKLSPELSEALVGLIADMPTVMKDATNPHFKNKYASLDAIWTAIRPILAKHGFALIQRTEPSSEGVLLETLLIHKTGHFLSARQYMPVAQKGNPQAIGSSLTYNRRYSISSLLALTTDEDEDANAGTAPGKPQPSVQPPSPAVTRKAMPGAIPPPTPAESQVWHGTITEVSQKSGTSTSGKPWTLWTVVGGDGFKASTFDRKHKDAAEFLSDSIVRITWTSTPKGGKNIFSIESAEEDGPAVVPDPNDSEVPF